MGQRHVGPPSPPFGQAYWADQGNTSGLADNLCLENSRVSAAPAAESPGDMIGRQYYTRPITPHQLSASPLDAVSAHILRRSSTLHCAHSPHQAFVTVPFLDRQTGITAMRLIMPFWQATPRPGRKRASVIADRWHSPQCGPPQSSMCVRAHITAVACRLSWLHNLQPGLI